MRIEFVSSRFDPWIGGVEAYVLQLGRHLVARGHDVTVHTSLMGPSGTRLPDRTESGGIHVRRTRMYPGWILLPAFETGSVVHVNSMGMSPNLVEPLRRDGHPRVFTPHGLFMTPAYRVVSGLILRSVMSRYSAIIALTQVERQHLVHQIGVDPRRVHVARIGVDDEAFSEPEGDIPPALSCVGVRPGKYVLSVGRLVSRKRFWVGVRAIAQFGDSLHYVIVGPLDDQRTVSGIKAEAKRLGVEARVHLTGPVTEAVRRIILRDAAVVLIPGFENYSIVAIESLALGRPVIGSDCPGLAEVLGNGSRGLLFPYSDPLAIVPLIRRALESPDEIKPLCSDGAAWVKARCRWPAIAMGLERVYQQCQGCTLSRSSTALS
jgi:glycosyltransferase involved in cell wall biosynthesis